MKSTSSSLSESMSVRLRLALDEGGGLLSSLDEEESSERLSGKLPGSI